MCLNICFSPCPATNGTDYSPPRNFQIEFGSSSLSGDSECVNVTISNDDFVEGREDFVVMVASVTPQVELSGFDSVAVTIVDNDCKIPEIIMTYDEWPKLYIIIIHVFDQFVLFWDFLEAFIILSSWMLSYGRSKISPPHTHTAAMASFSPDSITVTESDSVNGSLCMKLTFLPAGGTLECDLDFTFTPLQDTAGQKEETVNMA